MDSSFNVLSGYLKFEILMDILVLNAQHGSQLLSSSPAYTVTSTNYLSCCCSHWDYKKQGLCDTWRPYFRGMKNKA